MEYRLLYLDCAIEFVHVCILFHQVQERKRYSSPSFVSFIDNLIPSNLSYRNGPDSSLDFANHHQSDFTEVELIGYILF